jgi:hypothetical protein
MTDYLGTMKGSHSMIPLPRLFLITGPLVTFGMIPHSKQVKAESSPGETRSDS